MTVAETTSIIVPDPKPILTDSRNLIADAESLAVTDVVQHERAEKLIVCLKRTIKTLHEGDGNGFPGLDLHCDLTNRAHKAATQLRAASIDPYERALSVVIQKSIAYETEAKRLADLEAKKKELEARKVEENRILADAEAAPTEEEREAILNEPVSAPVVHVAPAVAKVAGSTTRDNWKAEGFDLMATVRYVAQHPEYAYLLGYSATGLTSIARSQRNRCTVPGVKVWNQPTKSFRETRSA